MDSFGRTMVYTSSCKGYCTSVPIIRLKATAGNDSFGCKSMIQQQDAFCVFWTVICENDVGLSDFTVLDFEPFSNRGRLGRFKNEITRIR